MDPYIKYRYFGDKREVTMQCSSAHLRIVTGEAEPATAEDRAAYVAWCAETGKPVAKHIPVAVAKQSAPKPKAVEPELEPAAPGELAEPEPDLIPSDFPHAADLAAAGILTFDAIPADLIVTKVKGIGRAGAGKVARALAARRGE